MDRIPSQNNTKSGNKIIITKKNNTKRCKTRKCNSFSKMTTKICLNDLRSYSRLWLTQLIQIYRDEECLWQGKHPDYSNHSVRNASYDKLVDKLKEVEPNPDRAMVVRKINSLRSAFRREYRKKMTLENYETKLWYFDKLMFIADQNPKSLYRAKKRELSISFEDDTIDYEHEEELDKNETIQAEEEVALVPQPIQYHVIKSEHNNGDNSQHHEQSVPQQTQQSSLKVLDITSLDVNSQREIQKAVDSLEQQHQQQVQQQMQNVHQNQQTQMTRIHHQQVPTIQISREHLPTLFNSTTTYDNPRQNDEFDAVGVNIASKLRVMNHTQRIIAEKLISDILFNGQLDNLNISSTIG